MLVSTNRRLLVDNGSVQKIRLLFVDDDEVDRENIIRMLSTSEVACYEMTIAKEFEHAANIITQNTFDICLIDYHLGNHTGLELIESIQKNNPHTSAILLTGQDDRNLDEQALLAGVADFLSKQELTKTLLERSIRYAIHHKKMALEKEYLAHYDSLTQLVNRHLFLDRLNHLTSRSHRYKRQHAILYIDLDYFKKINDGYGHDVGDTVLQMFADRLLNSIRAVDTAARLGGDEFAAILEEISPTNAHLVAQKIIEEIEKPFIINNITLKVSVSIGVTLFPNNKTHHPNVILKQADQALYHAKESGRKQYYVFDKSLRRLSEEKLIFEHDLELALNSENFYPVYQPQYCLNTGNIIGFEALARWLHPVKGQISPSKFIPYAEKMSLISLLTETMLKKTSLDSLDLMQDYPNLRMAINISASECSNPNLLSTIKEIVKSNNIEFNQLELEVTESVLITHPKESIKMLKALYELGIRIAIDDFGTGYSSLNYLTELPMDILKIDMSFVQGIGVSAQKEVVIQVIIDLAKRLELELVAEGVETQEQVDFLKLHGCDYVQGYFYSKPCSFNDFNHLFKN